MPLQLTFKLISSQCGKLMNKPSKWLICSTSVSSEKVPPHGVLQSSLSRNRMIPCVCVSIIVASTHERRRTAILFRESRNALINSDEHASFLKSTSLVVTDRSASTTKTFLRLRSTLGTANMSFLVMPFGLTNALATFQTLINNVFHHFLNIFLIVYLDDIVIYSNTLEDHLKHLHQVLDVLRTNELYAKPHKCIFGKAEIEFCEHIVGNGTVKVMQDKIKAIKDWPQPKNVHEVRQFLGLAGYYRRFIKNFGFVALPLFDLTKVEEQHKKQNQKPSKFQWVSLLSGIPLTNSHLNA